MEVLLFSDDKDAFGLKPGISADRHAIVDAEFERHVQARKLADLHRSDSAQVVNRVATLAYEVNDLGETRLSTIQSFRRDTRS